MNDIVDEPAPDWRKRSGWSPVREVRLWAKAILSSVPGALGSGMRRRLLGIGLVGSDVLIAEGFVVDYPGRLHIGEHVGFNRGCTINAGGGVTIGDWTLIGPGVVIYSQNHDLDGPAGVPLAMRPDVRRPVEIGRDVWIGARAIILAGVVVGDGAVIGAGAVVVRDVPSGAVVAGVPARVVKMRFEEAAVSRVEESQ